MDNHFISSCGRVEVTVRPNDIWVALNQRLGTDGRVSRCTTLYSDRTGVSLDDAKQGDGVIPLPVRNEEFSSSDDRIRVFVREDVWVFMGGLTVRMDANGEVGVAEHAHA
jgi:hypothetical protein